MKSKVLFSSLISVIIALSMSVGVYAGQNLQKITAYLNYGIKINLNGQPWQIKDSYGNSTGAITYNDTTYVPIRAAADAVGLPVGWDEKTQTILLGSDGTPSTEVKSYPVDVTVASGPMSLHITKVTLNPQYKKDYLDPINAVILTVEVENTSDSTVDWYPNQGTAVLNTKEQMEAASTLMYSDDVGGQFVGKVVKKGDIVLKSNSNLSDITTINFKVPGPVDDATFDNLGSDVIANVALK